MLRRNSHALKLRKRPRWMQLVSEPNEEKVFEALSDRNWDFRTVAGISRSTGVSEDEIARIIVKHENLVRKALVPDPRRRNLYTLRSRRVKGRELLAWARFLISKSVE